MAMIEFFFDYGLFLAKLGTVAVAIVVVVGVIVALTKRGAHQEGLLVEHLNKRLEGLGDTVRLAVQGKDQFKQTFKERKKEAKELAKKGSQRKRVYVIDFKGDIRATATTSLREEVSAVLAVASEDDQVLVRLENSGGTVHEHGLAASQLLRIKEKNIPLIISVDKVAASGGYLMACVASRIIAAPFAIVGSIGVIAQLPNFNRFLEDKGVDFEQITAGRYKRTVTMFGKNTDEDRGKLKEEIEDVHELFKMQILGHRPQIDIERIATGEHWYGTRALELGLIDEIRTSDDFLSEAATESDLYGVTFKRKKSLSERLLGGAESLLSR
jgi:serine protease SohB